MLGLKRGFEPDFEKGQQYHSAVVGRDLTFDVTRTRGHR